MRRLLAFFFLGSLLCYQGDLLADKPQIALGTGEFEPFAGQNILNNGALVELVSAVFKEIGMEPQYTFYPWKRAEQLAEEGKVFAIFPYVQTEERQKDFEFSDPIMWNSEATVLFYLKKNFPQGITYKSYEDLAAYKLGGVLGYWYEQPLQKAKLNVYYVKNDEASIQKLYLNRIQFAISDELVGWALIKRLYPQEIDQFAVVDQPLRQGHLRLMISRKYPHAIALTKQFNMGLESLRTKGIVRQILAKHGLKEGDALAVQ
jgi:polar amino acid transport system substrate-binding protein